MLTKKTVLVLGAGASEPYGFPTGLKLSELVSRHLRDGNSAFNCLRDAGIPDVQITSFRDAFYRSGRNSVDAFLEHRRDLLDIGKFATAAVLIPFENENRLFTYNRSWLRLLYNNLNTSFEDFGKNALSIITYNYDRSVEHFFMTSLQNSYGKNFSDCFKVLEAIPIIHLHGNLGPLPWQSSSDARPYVQETNRVALDVAAPHIKIIHEDIRDGRDADFQRAKQLLADAEQVFFLGFGYNKTNLERLGVAGLTIHKSMGTCVGMGEAEKREVRANCDGRVDLVSGDCYEIIQERVQWR